MITDQELDELGLEKVQNQLDRGDWVEVSEIQKVNSWLRKAKNEAEFLKKCERASVSSALDIKRLAVIANVVALLALIVSILALTRA